MRFLALWHKMCVLQSQKIANGESVKSSHSRQTAKTLDIFAPLSQSGRDAGKQSCTYATTSLQAFRLLKFAKLHIFFVIIFKKCYERHKLFQTSESSVITSFYRTTLYVQQRVSRATMMSNPRHTPLTSEIIL